MQLGFKMRAPALINILIDQPVIDKMIKGLELAQSLCKIFVVVRIKPSRFQKAPCGDDALKRVSDYGEFPGVLIKTLGQGDLVLTNRLVPKNNLTKQTFLHRITSTLWNVNKNAAQFGYVPL